MPLYFWVGKLVPDHVNHSYLVIELLVQVLTYHTNGLISANSKNCLTVDFSVSHVLSQDSEKPSKARRASR